MTSPFDKPKIMAIARRAADIYASHGARKNAADIADEIECVHDDIVRLRLDEMLGAVPSDLMRDVVGISRHLNIDSSPPTFTDCFVPRFAEYQVSPISA